MEQAFTSAEINQMILDTLNTKEKKEPKYRKELEELGIELLSGKNMSAYKNWVVQLKGSPTKLVLSRTYGRQRAVFDAFSFIARGENIAKVDFWRLLRVRNQRRILAKQQFDAEETKVDRYFALKNQKMLYQQDLRHQEQLIRDLTASAAQTRTRLAEIETKLKELFKKG